MGLGADLRADRHESLWPNKLGTVDRVVAGQVAFEPRERFSVGERRIAENGFAERRQARIVRPQFSARVDMVVVVVVRSVVVEPGLHAFREVLVVIH